MPYHRIISAVLIPATLLLFSGCAKTVWIGPAELQPEEKLKVVVTTDGHEVKLDPSAATLRGDTIYADAGEDTLRFALEEVQRVGVQRRKTAETVAGVIGVALVAAVAVVAIGTGSWKDMPTWSLDNSAFEY